VSVLSIPGIIRGGQTEKYGEGGRAASFTVGAAQAATGGLLLESMAGDRIVRTTQASSMICIAFAIHDAAAAAQVVGAMEGVWMLTASAAVTAGNKVITSATAGQVAVAGVAPDARAVVGRALQDIGAAGTGAVKLTL